MSNIAALIQIMSVGKQNKILNANPQITFWRFTHMRYTDFALEQVRVTANGSTRHLTNSGNTIHFDLPRAGDLCRNAFVVYHLPGLVNIASGDVAAAINSTLNADKAYPTGGKDAATAHLLPGQGYVDGVLQPGLHLNDSDDDAKRKAVELSKHGLLNRPVVAKAGTDFECVEDKDERQAIYDRYLNGKIRLAAGKQPYWTKNIGQYLTRELRLQVGSQVVDTVYDHYLRIWDELSDKPGRTLSANYGEMTMNGSAAQRKQWSRKRRSVFVPVPMFFSRTSGNAMPLIALSFHGVKFVLKTSAFSNCIMQKNPTITKFKLADDNTGVQGTDATYVYDYDPTTTAVTTYVRPGQLADYGAENPDAEIKFLGEFEKTDCTEVKASDIQVDMQVGYVYLGVAERNKFAEASFDILIDQVQRNEQMLPANGKKLTIDNIGFNHCVQEIVWCVTYQRKGETSKEREAMDYSGPLGNDTQPKRSVVSVQLRLNNSKRLTHLDGDDVPGDYFCQLDPYLHHTRVPEDVYAYSWAITPEGTQPSGACNFSRIDHSSFEITTRDISSDTRKDLASPQLHMYARNWNVFRVSLGLGGLKWAS